MEAILFSLGEAAAGVLFRFWLENSELAHEATANLDELIRRSGAGRKERRAMRRQFEWIGERIGERLSPFFEAEFGGLPPNEKRAAGEELKKTLKGAEISDALLFAVDLEPRALEEQLRESRPDAATEAFLSDAGSAFYDLLLRETCNCIVEIRMKLPDFSTQAARTMLARETELIDMVRTVLDRLPIEESSQAGNEAAAFEAEYRREVARKLDQLELFGVMTSEVRHRYSLSVAYLTLTASAKPGAVPAKSKQSEEDDRTVIPVDTALARANRLLVRGEAGSGKTTLLQWIAVNSARGSFEDSLADWNETVPFLIQLRRYVDTPLPTVDQFAAGINPHLNSPANWARDRLADGNAVVLVDGLDELPEERRQEAHEWIEDLVEAYPNSLYVVTSRPPAAGEDWLQGQRFDAVLMEPLELPAIRAFVDHWHDAAQASIADEEDSAELEELAGRLKAIVQENRAIRNLASSPLLCAMLCALNRARRAHLPSDRVELYRIALEMLLERRDVERKVRADVVDIGLREKEILLRVFAWWLLNNGKSFARRDDLEDLVEKRLSGMPRVEAGPREVVTHLLVRSGVLRQPVEGRIDFIHRTFLEYLAAKEAAETRSMGVLVRHAHLDQWQEVVVLAAGLAPLSMREELITGLLGRGENEQVERHRLDLLAVGCLETSAELAPELADKVNDLLQELIPPKSKTEARAIASAGEVAVPLLGEQAGRSTAVVEAACVRALTLIGSESALAQLERFGHDRRLTVVRELLRAWPEYNAEEFARRVLAHSPLLHGAMDVNSPTQLGCVRFLRHLEHLVCDGAGENTPGNEWPLDVVGAAPRLSSLRVESLEGLTDVSRLGGSDSLRDLTLRNLPDVDQLSVAKFGQLENLTVEGCKSLRRVHGLSSLDQMTSIELDDCAELANLPAIPAKLERAFFRKLPVFDIDAVAHGRGLLGLTLIDCRAITDISPISSHAGLSELSLIGCPAIESLDALSGMTNLRSVAIAGLDLPPDIDSLSDCRGLKELVIANRSSAFDLSWLPALGDLKMLRLVDCPTFQRLPDLGLTGLRSIDLSGCLELRTLEGIEGCTDLRSISIDMCGWITDLSPLRGLEKLQTVTLRRCNRVASLNPLKELPHLRVVDVRGTELDIDPLKGRGGRHIFTGPWINPRQPRPVILWHGGRRKRVRFLRSR